MKTDGTERTKHGWVCCCVFLVCAALIKPVQDRLESRLGKPGQEPDLLYFRLSGSREEDGIGL